MAVVVGGIQIDPQGQTLVVNITIPSTGGSVEAYTATTDRTFWPRTSSGAQVSFPVTISSPTTFYVTAKTDYLVSATANGVEVAGGYGQTVTVNVDSNRVTVTPAVRSFPEDERAQSGTYAGTPTPVGALNNPGTSTQAAALTDTAISVPVAPAPMGSYLVAPHHHSAETGGSTKRIRPNSLTRGITIDTLNGNSGNGVYGVFGPSQANSTFEAVVSVDAGYTGTGDDGSFPNHGFQHAGIAVRFTDSNDVAVIALISAASGETQIADKNAGTEDIIRRNAVAGGIAWGQKVRIRIVISGTTATVTWWDYLTGTQLDTYSYTVTVGTPASGYFAFHAYSCQASVHGGLSGPKGWDGSNILLFHGRHIWANNAAGAPTTSPLVTATATGAGIDFYSNGTNGSFNGWENMLLPIQYSGFVMRGNVDFVAARLFGISFYRDASNTQGYLFGYDNNGPNIFLKKGDADANSNVKTWTISALTAGTTYAFELAVHEDCFQLEINGATYAFEDISYSGPGYVGLCGFQGHALWSGLEIIPDLATGLIPAYA